MATLKGTRARDNVSARMIHAGMNVAYSEYTITASLSITDVLEMIKVPKGAYVLDVVVCGPEGGGDNVGAFTVGDGADPDRYIGSTSYSPSMALARLSTGVTGVGHNYSATFDTIDITITTETSATATGVFKMWASWTVDP